MTGIEYKKIKNTNKKKDREYHIKNILNVSFYIIYQLLFQDNTKQAKIWKNRLYRAITSTTNQICNLMYKPDLMIIFTSLCVVFLL